MAPLFGHGEIQAAKDLLVQQTDGDASISRLSAVTLGYLKDPFAKEFVLNPAPSRRLPIINRGTYVRTTTLDQLVESFITSNNGRSMQIISLGAGTDTRYWRLREKQIHRNLLYHEIDFPAVSRQKLAAIRSSKGLSPRGSSFQILHHVVPELNPDKYMWGFFRDGVMKTEGYLFHPVDLRKPFRIDNLRTDVPTLLISECCLCYLGATEAQNAIQYFTNLIPTIGIAIYEPTNPTSEFGRQMFANLASRRLYMPTVHEYPTMQKQMERLNQAGFVTAQTGADVLWLWKNWVSEEEKERISGLEMLDELEEWELLAKHYTVVWGWREWLQDKGVFQAWMDVCKGEIPYPETEPEVEVESDEDMSDVKIESIETES